MHLNVGQHHGSISDPPPTLVSLRMGDSGEEGEVTLSHGVAAILSATVQLLRRSAVESTVLQTQRVTVPISAKFVLLFLSLSLSVLLFASLRFCTPLRHQ